MTVYTFEELKELNGKSIEAIKHVEFETESPQYALNINGCNVFDCYTNKVTCTNDVFAVINFYNEEGSHVANTTLFNINDEKLIIKDDNIMSETHLRLLKDAFSTIS